MNYYVYEYLDPRTNLPFYIGKGKNLRLFKHLKETIENTENKRKFNYIQNLRMLGLEPTVNKIEENLSENDAYELEEKLIQKYGRRGLDTNGILMNICESSRPPIRLGKDHHNYGRPVITSHTEETKRKISESKKGKESWHKGRQKSSDTKARMSIGQQGKIVSDSTKKKLSELNSGEGNPNFGSIWITDGEQNMKIKRDIPIPNGWYKGRTFKKGYKHVRD